MAVRMRRIGDIYDPSKAGHVLKVLVVGPPGAGKTRFAATFPNPVFLDMEGRLLSIRERTDIPVFSITSIGDLEEVYAMLHQEPRVRRNLLDGYDVQTVVLDTVDEMVKIMIKERITQERLEAPRIQDYQYFADKGRSIMRSFRNLPGLNVIFNCHLRDSKDEESGRVEKRPDIPGALGNEIAAFVDEAWLMTARPMTDPATGDRVLRRYLQTIPDIAHDWVKDHSGVMPQEFAVNFEDDYARISSLIFGQASPPAPPSSPTPTQPVGKAAPVKKAAKAKAAVPTVPRPTEVPPTPEPEPEPAPEPEPEPEPVVEETPAAPEPEPEPEPETDDTPRCSECGEVIGNPDIAELSEIRFGKPLCARDFKAYRDRK